MTAQLKLTVLLATLLCCLAPGLRGENILINGDFSGGTYVASIGGVNDILPAGWQDYGPTPLSLTDLNVVSASEFPTIADTPGAANYMAFASSATTTQDCLLQDLNTVAGQAYVITFWAAITSASQSVQLTPDFDAFTNNDQIDFIPGFNNGMSPIMSVGPVAFEEFSFVATASSNSTALFFHGVDSQGAVLLADVSVTAQSTAPEPEALWLGGAGLAMIALYRYRRQ